MPERSHSFQPAAFAHAVPSAWNTLPPSAAPAAPRVSVPAETSPSLARSAPGNMRVCGAGVTCPFSLTGGGSGLSAPPPRLTGGRFSCSRGPVFAPQNLNYW